MNLVNYNKIRQIAKTQGISLTFLCKKIGMYPAYIADIQRKKLDMPEDRLQVIAKILNCSVAYLRDETDDVIDEETLDIVNEIDNDLLEKCGDIFHAKIAQEERNKSSKLFASNQQISEAEYLLVKAYRKHPELHSAIKRMLEIEGPAKKEKAASLPVRVAARSGKDYSIDGEEDTEPTVL